MKLYNVQIEDYFDASYEGLISCDYSALIFAGSESEAIEFMNKHLEDNFDANAVSAHVISMSQSKGKTEPFIYVNQH
mgnify:CR=1 FL=1